jgi:Icc-related predicted phosphoesterase
VRILAVADAKHPALDSHFEPERWRGVELLLGCGDLPADYLDYLATSLGVPFLYVRGNHDANLWERGQAVGENIDGRLVRYKGLNIVGFEGCAWYGGKGIEYSQLQMRWRVYSALPMLLMSRRVDLVVSHAPPALRPGEAMAVEQDLSARVDLSAPLRVLPDAPEIPEDHAHRGFFAFTTLLRWFRPRLWLHGHVHLNYSRASRVRRHGRTLIASAYQYVLLDV